MNHAQDRRVRKTQSAIRDAFISLVVEKDFEEITIADILSRADVARSTFYQHFDSKDEVLGLVILPLLTPFAQCVVSDTEPPHLLSSLEHFWSNRQLGRAVLFGSSRVVITRRLAELIENNLNLSNSIPAGLVTGSLAKWQLCMLEEWLSGKYHFPAHLFATTLHRCARVFSRELPSISVSSQP